MEDKLFCTRCNLRIWRGADDRKYTDQYFDDQHFNCLGSLGMSPPMRMVNGMLEQDRSFTEYDPHSKVPK